MTAGKGDDLLDLALQNQRNEQVEQMDVSDNTGLKQLRRYGFQFLNFLASVTGSDSDWGQQSASWSYSQYVNTVECVEQRQISSIGNQVINATLANDVGGFRSSFLQAGMTGEISMDDSNVVPTLKLFCYLLLGCSLVSNQAEYQVLRILGQLLHELELAMISINTGDTE